MNRVTIYDVEYDDGTQDLKVTSGDITFISTHEAVFDQLIKDALESTANSMKHILPRWGNEGKSFDFTTVDNLPKQKMELYFEEMLNALGFLFKTELAFDVEYDATTLGFSGFEYTLEAIFDDILSTSYNKDIQWNQSTSRATIV